MILSGSHVLFGTFTLSRAATSALDDWLAQQTLDTEFDRRDATWWVYEVSLPEGRAVHLFDEARTGVGTLRRIGSLVEHLGRFAVSGSATLQWVENGTHVTHWTIGEGGVLSKAQQSAAAPQPVPSRFDVVKRALSRVIDQHTAEYNARSPQQRFAEVCARHAPELSCALLTGSSPGVRRDAADRLAAVMTTAPVPRWTGGEPSTSEVIIVDDLLQLPHDAQLQLCDQLRERQVRAVVCLSSDAAAHQAIREGRLAPPLWGRLEVGRIDLDAVHP